MSACSECKYWEGFSQALGDCHKHAPLPYQSSGSEVGTTMWPRTGATDWCGDFSPHMRDEGTAAEAGSTA